MAKQITKTVYTFSELLTLHAKGEVTAAAVEKAKDWLRQGQTDGEWYDCCQDDWQTALEQIGFTDADIAFSGFWSQGDGASFTSGLDIEKLIAFLSTDIEGKPQILDGEPNGWLAYVVHKLGSSKVTNPKYDNYLGWIVNYLHGKVQRDSHRYSHENTCSVYLECDLDRTRPEIEQLVNEFEKDVEQLRYRLCKIIYAALEEDYEGLTSNESLADFADANEYTFEANGRREG